MNMTMEEAAAFASESYTQSIDSSLNTASRTQHMVQTLGLNDKPTVVSREEFDEIASRSLSGKVYRGVVDNVSAGVSADEIVDMTVYGELNFLGNGIHSDGIYFSTQRGTAEGYASQGGRGRVMEACFSDGARIADYNELLAKKSASKIDDVGTFALYSGYNAVRVRQGDGEDYLIALDRSCLVFCDTRSDSEGNSGRNPVDGEKLGKTFNEFIDFKRNGLLGFLHGSPSVHELFCFRKRDAAGYKVRSCHALRRNRYLLKIAIFVLVLCSTSSARSAA